MEEAAPDATEVPEDAVGEDGKKVSADATKDEQSAENEKRAKEEAEADAEPDDRGRLAERVRFLVEDSTPNVMPVGDGRLLMALKDGALRQLVAAARANVGMKAGRYMLELMVVESRSSSSDQSGSSPPAPSQPLVRVGFSAFGASLFLPYGDGNVYFDSEGNFGHGKIKRRVSQKFGRDEVIAVVLNLDPESKNSHTVSMFRDGVRACEPQPLPEELRGKPLFPAVNFKGASIRVNFGPSPLRPLPFRCAMLQGAASADCDVAPCATSEDGRHEVLFPVGLPEEGTLDWLDQLLTKDRKYTEISERMLSQWASKSGVAKRLDEGVLAHLMENVFPLLPRDYVVVDVKGNLLEDARRAATGRFASCDFRKKALVVMGEPPDEFKESVRDAILKEKKAKAAADAPKRPKPASNATKDAEENATDATIELTETEKSAWFRTRETPDLPERQLAGCFARFSLPEESEGFESVAYGWQPAEVAKEHMRQWTLRQKRLLRVEDIQPGPWFKDKWSEWQKYHSDCKKKQTDWKQVLEQLNEWKKEGKQGNEEKKEGDEDDEEKPTEIDADTIDVFSVKNVDDIGSGEPLFAKFQFEDWSLLTLRFELHLLLYGFRRDVDDPDRLSFLENHLNFYYNRYFKKNLNLKFFGVSSIADLMELVRDTMQIDDKTSLMAPQLECDSSVDHFVKATEEHRRERSRRLDAGDETAALKFVKQPPPHPENKATGRGPGVGSSAPSERASVREATKPTPRTTTHTVKESTRTAPRAATHTAPRSGTQPSTDSQRSSTAQRASAAPRASPPQSGARTSQSGSHATSRYGSSGSTSAGRSHTQDHSTSRSNGSGSGGYGGGESRSSRSYSDGGQKRPYASASSGSHDYPSSKQARSSYHTDGRSAPPSSRPASRSGTSSHGSTSGGRGYGASGGGSYRR